MEVIYFAENISLQPSMLNANIFESIRKIVQDKYKSVCTKKWGYIVDIKDVKVLSNIVDRVSSSIFFNIGVWAERFLPREGLAIPALVQMCFQHGILCKYRDLSILVPMSTIKDVKYENGRIQSGSQSIMKGDEISVSLVNVKYEKHKFSAIGNLYI
jgi:DNA-directed RNA polymerase subunit E'/Rpb7